MYHHLLEPPTIPIVPLAAKSSGTQHDTHSMGRYLSILRMGFARRDSALA